MLLKSVLICFVVICNFSSFSQPAKNEDDLKKQAEKLFENEEYNLAYKLYAQLVSNYPKDPEYNYRLGVCMLYTEPDKKKPFSYLKIATNNPKDAPKDAKFYLAKTYHINYQFDEAIKLYNEYKLIGSASSIKKLQVDREIEACKNGKRLLSNITDLVVLTKKQLNEADYFRSYDVSGIGGKLLVKPEDFKSAADKKKKEKSVIYLPKTGDKVYYSSYGENGDKGRDLYVKTKIAGGFSAPQLLPSIINTEYDEDYPFLHPNGKTLYFSSKGHNSMGGYDVFKTTFDDKTLTWTKPVNLEFPICSPDDDILFVTDSLEKTAYFSTGRYSPYGKIDVLKINIERRPINFAYLKGTVVKEDVTQSLNSKITVKNLANGEIVGVFQAENNGNYKIEIPNGGKFAFTVETPGIATQTQNVNVPVASSLKPYKQMISYDKKILRITNYFDGNADDGYELIRDLIEKKAKLEMSDDATIASSNNTSASSATKIDGTLNAVSSGNPTVSNTNTNSQTTSTQASSVSTSNNQTNETNNFSNEKLLEIAKTDAKEASEEATKLKQEAEDAFGLATQKTTEAQNLQKEADALFTNANLMSDGSAKKDALNKANNLKDNAKIATDIANTANDLAKKLEVDANVQKQEADLTNQYIKEIESVIKNKNNKEALAKLEQIQNQLTELSKQKNQSDELYESLKAEGELKQNELKKQEKKKEDAVNGLTAINNEVKELEKDLTNENDNELKESIKAQIRELNTELTLKTKEVENSTEKVNRLTNEVAGINKEIEMTNAILTGKAGDIVTNNQNQASNTTASNNQNQTTNLQSDNQLPIAIGTVTNNTAGAYSLTYESITNNYKKDIEKKVTTKEDLINQNDAIAQYNSDIKELIDLDKGEAAIAADPKDKKKYKDEIAKLEKQKADNDKLVIANNQKLKQIDASSIPVTASSTSLTNSVSALNSSTLTLSAVEVNSVIATPTVTNNNIQSVTGNQITANNNSQTTNTSTNQALSIPSTGSLTASASSNENQIKEIETIKSTINNNLESATKLFEYANYKDPSSVALKQSSLNKYNTALQTEASLKSQLANLEKNNQSNTQSSTELLLKANTLNDEALAIRQQVAGKKGTEKEALQKQITEKEKLAVELKIKASEILQNENKQQFELNNLNLLELKKLMTSKPNIDQSQANMQMEEATINFKQANSLREEANVYPVGVAKLGGLSNAEEKEAEALLKQQKAIDFLLKENPTYQLKKAEQITNPTQAIAELTKKLDEVNKAKTDAFNELSKLNQNELEKQGNKLQLLPSFNSPENKESQTLKTQSDILKTEAQQIINTQIPSTTNETEKQKLLLSATNKEIEALNLLSEANQKLKTNVASTNTITNQQAATTASSSTNNSQTVITNTSNGSVINSASNNQNPTTNNSTTSTLSVSSSTISASNNQTTNTTNLQSVNSNNNQATNNQNLTTNNGIGDDANKLKTALNNVTEATLPNFTSYTNQEAILLKNKAIEKITVALNEDKKLSSDLDNVVSIATISTQTTSGEQQLSQQSINNVTIDAEKMNDEALVIRQNATTKTGAEKEILINKAKELETKAIDKKLDAASKQEQLNNATFNANERSLEELEKIAKGKNISELYVIEMQLTEAEILMKQSVNLRAEANAYPNNAAKLGGLSNAEEKEALAIQKQEAAMNTYKKYFPNYKAIKANTSSVNPEAIKQLNTVKNAINSNEQQHIDGLLLLADANTKEYNGRLAILKQNLKPNETALKTKAQITYKQSQTLLTQAKQEPNLTKKKSLLVESDKKGQEAINYLTTLGGAQIAVNNGQLAANNQTTSVNNITGVNIQNTNGNGQIINSNNQASSSPSTTSTRSVTTINTIATNNQSTNNSNTATSQKSVTANSNQALSVSSPTAVSNNQNQATNNNTPTTNVSTLLSNQNSNRTVLKVKEQELSVKNNNAYSDTKPIPLDEKMPKGLYFKVQIGSFKQQIPNSTFKGLTPLSAQTSGNGYIRYMAGNFGQFEDANALKNDLKKLGYNDAFVVAYFDGERIPLLDAPEKTEKPIEIINNTNSSVGITTAANVPTNPFPTVTPEAAPVVDLEKINGLLYTIQVGIYSRPVAKGALYNLRPLYRETLPNGLYRYTAGIYNQAPKVLEDKTKVNNLGIKDAFASSYYNGKRIAFDEGRKLQAENAALKMETQNPIIFNGEQVAVGNTTTLTVNNTITNNQIQNTVTVKPFTNGVTNAPTPTADNGVKADETGISYKVQVGAYRNQVPADVANKFMAIKTWPVSNLPINGLYIYTIGNFTSSSFAKKLKDEAVSLGLTDAFVTVYKDGKKLYGTEATEYLNK